MTHTTTAAACWRAAGLGITAAALLIGSAVITGVYGAAPTPEPRPAVADNPAPDQRFWNRVDELVEWIGARTDYPPRLDRRLAVLFVPKPSLNYIFFEGATNAGYSGQDSVKALYIDGGMMFLADDFKLGRDDYVLLHELVHHLQYTHDAKFACHAEREREAYELQIEFVEEFGRGEIPGAMFMSLLGCHAEY